MVSKQQLRSRFAILIGIAAAVCLILAVIAQRSAFSEPTHTAARLNGSVAPKVCSTGGSVVALRPDGRIWISKVPKTSPGWRTAAAPHGMWGQGIETAHVPIPEAGVVLPGAWLDVVCSENDDWAPGMQFPETVVYGQFLVPDSRAVAIRADGHLERFAWNPLNPSTPPRFERIGSDSDWKAFLSTASTYSFYAMKTDGTLWSGDFPMHSGFSVRNGVDSMPLSPPPGFESMSQFIQQYEAKNGNHWRLKNTRDFRLRNGTLERTADKPGESAYSSLSRYSDWIAADGRHDFVALAADGTICGWSNDDWIDKRRPASSNRPLWCLNVIAAGERI
jgi:hypothetical protein